METDFGIMPNSMAQVRSEFGYRHIEPPASVALTGSFGGTVPLSPIAADGDNMSFATRPMSADGSSVMSTMSTKSALSSTQAAGRIQGSVFARREHEAGSSSDLPSKLGAIDWNPSTKSSAGRGYWINWEATNGGQRVGDSPHSVCAHHFPPARLRTKEIRE